MSFPNTTHFDISGDPDMGAVMEMLAGMPTSVRDKVMHKTEQQMEQAAAASTRKGLIEHFLKARENARDIMRELGSERDSTSTHYFTTTNSSNVKPSRSKTVPLSDCTPLTVSSMALDTTHRHRFLCGKVAVGDSFRQIQHMYFLLEDIQGDLVRVCVYNTNRIFRLNESIAVVEPFFKIALDMIPVLRIDQPDEIVAWKAPETCLEWKQLGNGFVAAEDSCSAIHCYESALKVKEISDELSALSTLYNNIALCESRLGRYQISVWYAGTAVFLDPENIKAWYRILEGLFRIDIDSCREVLKVAPTSPALNEIRAKVGMGPSLKRMDNSFRGETAWSNFVPVWSLAPDIHALSKVPTAGGKTARERGTELFQNGDFQLAKDLYIMELQGMKEVVSAIAVLSSNMSAAHKMERRHGDAMLLSTISVMLDKTNAKPWIRRSNVLELVDGPSEARRYLEQIRIDASSAGDWEGRQTFINKLEKEIKNLSQKEKNQSKVTQVGELTTDEQLQDRETRDFSGEDRQDLDEYITSMEHLVPTGKRMASMMPCQTPAQQLTKKLATRQCPKIHDEFSKYLGFPIGLNRTHASKIMYRGFLDASNQPWHLSFMMSRNMFPVHENMLLKRWNGPLGVIHFSQRQGTLAVGSILDVRPRGNLVMYDPYIRSMFVNAPSNPLTQFAAGSTHVSIGFNDLGELLSSSILGLGSPDTARPLYYVGYEKSEFCIARSLVMQEMLMDPKIPITSVFQVWYSAGWTKETLKLFRLACKKALSSCCGRNAELIASYLHCWLSAEPLSAIESRLRWFDTLQKHTRHDISNTCSLHRLKDRLAVLLYFATGELIPAKSADTGAGSGAAASKKKNSKTSKHKSKKVKREPADYGSLTFWNVPPNCAPLESDSILNTTSLETLLEHLDDKQNIIDTLMCIKQFQLTILRRQLLDGEVVVDLRYGDVNQDNTSLIAEIVSLRPETVSWSNLLDYSNYEYHSFHSIAKQLKAQRHFGYSMNWVILVYGACMTDYLYAHNEPVINELLIQALQEYKGSPTSSSASQQHPLLTKPLFDTPLNLGGYVLAHRMKGHWIEYFAQQHQHGTKVVAATILQEYPFYRNSRALFLEWKYE